MAFQVKDGYGSVISIDSSVFGTAQRQIVGASVIGTFPVTISGNPSVSGTVNIGNIPQASVHGQVVISANNGTLSGTTNSPGNISLNFNSLSTNSWTRIYDSVLGLWPPLMGTRNGGAFVDTGASSVILAGTPNVNTSGSVVAFQGGGWTASIVNTVPSSVLVGASIFGQLPAGTAVLGSVATLQGTNPWFITGSIQGGVSILGGTVTVTGTVADSANVAEDVAHVDGQIGKFVLGVRNDTVASFAGSNGDYTPHGFDSAGRTVIKPFAPEEARIEGYISLTSTSMTTLVAAAGAGLKNYITDIWAANTGATTTLLTFSSGGGSSVLGYTIVPTGGGSNLIGLHMPIRTEANATFGVQAGTATSTLYVTVKGYKAP